MKLVTAILLALLLAIQATMFAVVNYLGENPAVAFTFPPLYFLAGGDYSFVIAFGVSKWVPQQDLVDPALRVVTILSSAFSLFVLARNLRDREVLIVFGSFAAGLQFAIFAVMAGIHIVKVPIGGLTMVAEYSVGLLVHGVVLAGLIAALRAGSNATRAEIVRRAGHN